MARELNIPVTEVNKNMTGSNMLTGLVGGISMREINCDVAIIGAGPAGLAVAVAAKKQGAERVIIVERDTATGGILQQCIHAGFGLSS